jgi:hypothetical protein
MTDDATKVTARPISSRAWSVISSGTAKRGGTAGNDGLKIPVPTVGVRQVRVAMPHVPQIDLSTPRTVVVQVAHGVTAAPGVLRRHLPDRNRLLFYGGLGALAIFDAISWPVAAAIGTGVWVAGRARSESGTAGS